MRYRYSDDLTFRLVDEYLFTGDGLKDASFQPQNALQFNGGSDDEDAQYIELRAELKF